MDWLPIVTTLLTGLFLIPMFNDFRRKQAKLVRRLSLVQIQIREVEGTIEAEKRLELGLKDELEEATKEMKETERDRHELQKAVELKTKNKR